MLDLSTVKITILMSEYIKNNILFTVTLFILLFLIYYMCSKKMISDDTIYCCTLFFVFNIIFILWCPSLSAAISEASSFDYCEVTVKVVPSKKLTIKQLQASDNFIEKDGDYYYVKRIKKPLTVPKNIFFKNMNSYLYRLENDFNRNLDSMYFQDKAISK